MAHFKRSDQDKPVKVSEMIPHIEGLLRHLNNIKDNDATGTIEFNTPVKEVETDDPPGVIGYEHTGEQYIHIDIHILPVVRKGRSK